MMDRTGERPWRDTVLSLHLTEQQSHQLFHAAGVRVTTLRGRRLDFVRWSLAAEAMQAGRSPTGGSRLVILELTATQRDTLRRSLGTPVSTLLFGPGLRKYRRYYEPWTSSFAPFSMGRLRVTPHDIPLEPDSKTRSVRLMGEEKSEGAYGTGRLSSTRIAVQLLEAWLEPGSSVGDIGTGSGILAIAAVRLGARRVSAFEIDVRSAEQARRNVELNGLTEQIIIVNREVDARWDGTFDILTANLMSDDLVGLAPTLATVVRRGGILIISGASLAHIDEIGAIFESEHFNTLEQASEGEVSARALRLK